MQDIVASLERLKQELHTDFPIKVGTPVQKTLLGTVTNFFRNGPKRKVVVFASAAIEFQGDGKAREDDRIALERTMFDTFELVLEQAEQVFGSPLGQRPPDRDSVMHVRKYHYYDEGDSGDDTEWTPEYEQGALLCCEQDRTRFWLINERYLFLQGGLLTRERIMVGYVAMTITPKLGGVEPTRE